MAEEKTYNKVVVVNEADEIIGAETMHSAIDKGMLRSGVRVFVFNQSGHMLLQRRSKNVGHPLFLSIAAAGHVDVGESRPVAALRELQEEIGISGYELTEIDNSFRSHGTINGVYKLIVPDDIKLVINTEEVKEVQWMEVAEFEVSLTTDSSNYTPDLIDTWSKFRDKLIAK